MTQLLCHLWGDYILQSDWMANGKTKHFHIALIHAICYTAPFLLLTWNWRAIAVILITHTIIDRWRLARFVVRFKNVMLHPEPNAVQYGTATGYPESCPPWMAIWLLIIADNILHLTINYLALRYL